MAPIRSQDAELVFDITQANNASGPIPASRSGAGGGEGTASGTAGGGGGHRRSGAPKRVGSCRVSLRELADQREHDLPLTVLKKVRHAIKVAFERYQKLQGSRDKLTVRYLTPFPKPGHETSRYVCPYMGCLSTADHHGCEFQWMKNVAKYRTWDWG